MMQSRFNPKSQSGFSVFLVIGLLIMTTIVTTAVYRALNQVDKTSADGMRLQTADAAAESGKAAAESFMTYHGGEMVAMMQQYYDNQQAGGELPAIQFPLESMDNSKGQSYRVSLVDLNSSTQPMEVKIQSEGSGSDGSKKIITAVYYIKGVYNDELVISKSSVSLGFVVGTGDKDAIWAGQQAQICGNVSVGNGAYESSMYIGENASINTTACPSTGNLTVSGDVVFGASLAQHHINNIMTINGDFYSGGEINIGGSGTATLNTNGNTQLEADYNVLYGTNAWNANGSVLMNADFSSAGSGSMAISLNDDFKMDGDITGEFNGTFSISSNGTAFCNGCASSDYTRWDVNGGVNNDAGSATITVSNPYAQDATISMPYSGGSNTSYGGAYNAYTGGSGFPEEDIDLDDILENINSQGDKNHPFYIKSSVENAYSKTWADWVALCSTCDLSATLIRGDDINTLIEGLTTEQKDELFVNGAPVIDANDPSIKFRGGILNYRAIIRNDDNTDALNVLPETSDLGSPGGNLVFLTNGSYENFSTQGPANVVLYSTGTKFDVVTSSGETLYGTITAKAGSNLTVRGNGRVNYDQDVLDDAFGSSGGGGIFSNNPADENFVNPNASTSSTNDTLDATFRLLAPTLSIQFMGSFENQTSVIEQQGGEGDAGASEDAKPYLDFNKQRILSNKGVYTTWEEMRVALNVEPIYSYKGQAANCTAPTSGDWDASNFDPDSDSTFIVYLSINCSADGDTVSTKGPIYITMGEGSGSEVTSSTVVGSSQGGVSSNGGSDSLSSNNDGNIVSSGGEVSSQSDQPVCDTIPSSVLHGVKNFNTTKSVSNPAIIGGLTTTGSTYSYQAYFKHDLSSITGSVTSATLIVEFGATSGWQYASNRNVAVFPQTSLSSWNTSTGFDELTTSWGGSDTIAATYLSSGNKTTSLYGEERYPGKLLDWVNLYAGDLDNPGLAFIAETGYWDASVQINEVSLYVCATTIDGGVSSSEVVSSSSEVISSSVVSSSSLVSSSNTVSSSSSVPVTQWEVTFTTDGSLKDICSPDEFVKYVNDGDNLSVSVSCDAPYDGDYSSWAWKRDDGVTVKNNSPLTWDSFTPTKDTNFVLKAWKTAYTVGIEAFPLSGMTTISPNSVTKGATNNTGTITLTPATNWKVAGYYDTEGDYVADYNTPSINVQILAENNIVVVLESQDDECADSDEYADGTQYYLGEWVYVGIDQYQCNKAAGCIETPSPGSVMWDQMDNCVAADPCDGIGPWRSGYHWSYYTNGDKRTSSGGLYSLKNKTWAQSYAPHTSAGLQYGWTFIEACN